MINYLREIEKEYFHYSSLLSEADNKKNDLLHLLELDKSGYRERCKIGSQLRRCLIERRKYKDIICVRAPIVEFLKQNKGILERLGQALGDTRKAEKHQQNRTYHPRASRVAGEKQNENTKDKK